jgi:hypothetical protein
MTTLRSALLVLLATMTVACNRVDSAETKAAADTADAERATNQSSPSPLPATAATVADGQPVNAMGAAILAFHKHLEAYMKVHNEAEGKVPNLKRTDDPVEISAREKALAETIMTLRAGAQEGVVFAPDVQPHFRTIITDDFARRSLADRRALVHELPKGAKVSVNVNYPTTIPLITFPAALLQKLPDLPPELEYRIVGRHLILRDVKANLIVDVLRDAIPST